MVSELSLTYKRVVSGQVKRSSDVESLFRQVWEGMEIYESVWAAYLDQSNNVVGIAQIGVGDVSCSLMPIRKIMQLALLTNASGIIIAHNHPSGQLKASQADKDSTKRIETAANTLDLKLLDHLILTEADYLSFADQGLL